MYNLKYDRKLERSLIQDSIRRRIDIPREIANAPELWIGSILFYKAFNELSTCRQLGMNVGPIPFTSILQYCQFHQFDYSLTEEVIYLVSRMDEVFLNHIQEKTKKETKTPARKSRR